MRALRLITLATLPILLAACNPEKVTSESDAASAQTSQGEGTQSTELNPRLFEERFSKLGLDVLDIAPSAVAGLVEVKTSGGTLFATQNADYFFAGTLYSLDKDGKYTDVLAAKRAPENAAKISAVSDTAIEYKADNEKYVVTVFTDITCGYCVRLHRQMKDYNKLGITIRYLAFPRYGLKHQVAEQMAGIWCAQDPAHAMHMGKVEKKLPEITGKLAQCKSTVAQHYQLGKSLGINGTPAIFLPNGEMVAGYLEPDALLDRLEATQ